MSDIKTRVKRVIQEQTGVRPDEIADTATYDDLGMDSIDEIELVMALEEEFEIEIPDASAETFKNVQDVVDYVTGLGSIES